LGFTGSDAQVLARAAREAPDLLAACSSSSSMWAANAATVCPSADSADGRVHFTPANLAANFHRSLEPPATGAVLRLLFPEGDSFVHHAPLPAGAHLGDEGAANHLRLCPSYGEPGVQVFVFGRRIFAGPGHAPRGPTLYPARQAAEASEAVARLHGLAPERTVFARQSAAAIDAGAFHNDVVAVGNEALLLYHRRAFAEPAAFAAEVSSKFSALSGGPPLLVEIPEERLTLDEAVSTYFFNSQLVTLPGGGMLVLAPVECREHARARTLLEETAGRLDPPACVEYVDLRQSMRNGGGPACLRLRVVLTPRELEALRPGCLLSSELYEKLTACITKRYREHLLPADLADPLLLRESREALDELSRLLGLGSIYRFQRAGADRRRVPDRSGSRLPPDPSEGLPFHPKTE
ncbi:MAG: N-succinylarginine dihydrolase, partial [Deltaproteobacteria bacterium]|nr:N-succinylarginine dihydrolase [Deltaproteobacteria bacterium]